MNQTLLTGLSKDEQEALTNEFKHSRKLLDRLIQICENKYKEADQDANKRVHYEKASWSMYQADRIGTKRTLKEIQRLLEK